jgi:soluble lytic murein transglycosylase-like protein
MIRLFKKPLITIVALTSLFSPVAFFVLLASDTRADAESIATHVRDEIAFPPMLSDIETKRATDPGLILWRNSESRGKVLSFYTEITGSERISRAILENAERFGIPSALAFALAYEESAFKPDAVNYNNDSVDRGLFQLNSLAFPKLSKAQFFEPETNALYGLSHLNFLISIAGNDVAGLAMYNAGSTRVSNGGTPRKTLDYIARILDRRAAFEKKLEAELSAYHASIIQQAL